MLYKHLPNYVMFLLLL